MRTWKRRRSGLPSSGGSSSSSRRARSAAMSTSGANAVSPTRSGTRPTGTTWCSRPERNRRRWKSCTERSPWQMKRSATWCYASRRRSTDLRRLPAPRRAVGIGSSDMATDSNSITISGNITRDPEMRYTPSGISKVTFGVAVNRSWRNQQSQEWEEQTSFFNVVAWRQLAENVGASLTKGSRVVVSGRLEQRSWETEAGEKRSIVEIVADDVAPSLRFATAEVHKVERSGPGDGGGGPSRRPAPAPTTTSTSTSTA